MSYLSKLLALPKTEGIKKGIAHTPAEIRAQPRLWKENFERLLKRKDDILSFLVSNTFSKPNPRVILTGAGSSANVGLSVQNLIRYRWQLDVDTRPTTEIITHWDSVINRNTNNTMISFSRSGNSPESVGACVLAERLCPEISHVIVTCNERGRLARFGKEKGNALVLSLSKETNDKGLAMTASFTTMLVTAQFLASINDPSEYEPAVRDLSEATELLFEDYSDLLKEIADIGFTRAMFLGSGCLYGSAVESCLKLQEMTGGHIICKAETFLGVRHGPEVVMDDETLVVLSLSSDPTVRKYEVDLMREIRAKGLGKKTLVICNKVDKEIERCASYVIEFNRNGVFNITDFHRPAMDVTVGQLLGLFKSLALGLKPDNPGRRGVISRVVRGVKIYDNETLKKGR